MGIEVLYDDRGEKAGFSFNDADLIGIPFRLVTSPKKLPEGQLEFKCRGEKEVQTWNISETPAKLKELIDKEMNKYNI
jgi:prolyl-tRNA synthetase